MRIAIATAAILVMSGCASEVSVSNLRCEYLVNPLGIDAVKPRISWVIESEHRGWKQGAYRVLVASSAADLRADIGDLWDSGKVASDQTAQVEYQGKTLDSRVQCWWKVQVWDRDGRASKWSEPAAWSMGLLNRADWQAHWISDGVNRQAAATQSESNKSKPSKCLDLPSAYMRKEFKVNKAVRRATVYVTALGLYELYINGVRVGDEYFTPGWTQYDKRANYQTYDVTAMLEYGQGNALGAIMGAGWYVLRHAGEKVELLVQLEIDYKDGTKEVIVSDGSWKATNDGPILSSNIFDGEHYDAGKEMAGWSRYGYDDSNWKPVELSKGTEGTLTAHAGVPIRRIMNIRPVKVTEPNNGVYVFDMGQNFAGWARIRVKGPPGTKVTIRYAERVSKDGLLDTKNLGSARCTDSYILNGQGLEEWEPRFTSRGFQYVELTGYPGKPGLDDVTGVVVHSDLPVAGLFECSNEMLNKLWRNIVWSQRSNYFDVPMDCPQRNERMGWTGDAQIFIRTGCYNMDSAAFYTNWLRTLNDMQTADGAYPDFAPLIDLVGTAGWADAAVICPLTIYQMYGDKRLLERYYYNMVKWIEYQQGKSKNYLRPEQCWPGDWLNVRANTPKDLITNAYFAYSTRLMAEIADVLGKEADAKKFRELFENIKEAFNKAYIEPDGKIKGNTQTDYLMALSFALVDGDRRAQAQKHLIECIEERGWRLSTGFLGVKLLLPTLTDIGRDDVAYKLLLNDTYPSWGYPVKSGAATIWEAWEARNKDGTWNAASMNHYAYGSVGEWMFSTMAGIDTDGPGFSRIIIRPRPCREITFVRAGYVSVHGKIETYWQYRDGRFKLDVTIPANTTATVYVPAKDAGSVMESGRNAAQVEGLKLVKKQSNAVVYEIGSGRYSFVSNF